MSSEIAMRDEELTELLARCEASLQQLDESKDSADSSRLVGSVEEDLKQADHVAGMMRLEFRHLKQAQKKTYRDKLRDHKQRLRKFRNDLDWARQKANRAELLGEDRDRVGDLPPDMDTAAGVMEHGRQVQKDSIASLENSAKMTAETQVLGRETAVKVAAATEQIANIHDDLYEIDNMLERSTAILKRMMRRTLTSKYIWVLSFLFIVGIIVIIALRASGKDDPNTRDRLGGA